MALEVRALPEDELIALLLGVSLRTARWLLWLKWRFQIGRLGGPLDGALG